MRLATVPLPKQRPWDAEHFTTATEVKDFQTLWWWTSSKIQRQHIQNRSYHKNDYLSCYKRRRNRNIDSAYDLNNRSIYMASFPDFITKELISKALSFGNFLCCSFRFRCPRFNKPTPLPKLVSSSSVDVWSTASPSRCGSTLQPPCTQLRTDCLSPRRKHLLLEANCSGNGDLLTLGTAEGQRLTHALQASSRQSHQRGWNSTVPCSSILGPRSPPRAHNIQSRWAR